MDIKIISASKEATFKLGELIAACVRENDVIALEGDLGAGKTKLTSGLASALGFGEEIVSPTFTILRDYERGRGQRLSLYHFDAYRLKNESEFEALGFDEYFDKNGVTIIEWADIICDVLPARTIRIYFTIDFTNIENEPVYFLQNLQQELCELYAGDELEETNDFTQELSSDKEDQRKRLIRIEGDEDFIRLLQSKLSEIDVDDLQLTD